MYGLQHNYVNQLPDADGVATDDLFTLSREGRWRKLSAPDLIAAISDTVRPLYGAGPPSDDLGEIGSFYYDISGSPVLYGPKSESGWGPGIPLQGPPGGNVMSIGVVSAIPTLTIPIGTDAIYVSGFVLPGVGAARWLRQPSQPAHFMKVQDQSGVWWAIDFTQTLNAQMFGIIPGDNAANGTGNSAVVYNMIRSLPAPTGAGQSPIYWPTATYHFAEEINVKARITWYEDGIVSFVFPKGKYGILIHENTTDGPNAATVAASGSGAYSVIGRNKQCFSLVGNGGVRVNGGLVLDQRGDLLFYRGISTSAPVVGVNYEFHECLQSNYTTSAIGSATVATKLTTTHITELREISAQFASAGTITGGTSGATATVVFASDRHPALAVTGVSGTFAVGEVVTQSGTGATARVARHRSRSGTVAQVTGLTGFAMPTAVTSLPCTVMRETGFSAAGLTMLVEAEVCLRTVFWNGDGGRIVGGADGFGGNVNRWKATDFTATNCIGNGLIVAGGDGNAGLAIRPNCVQNMGVGVVDRGFLGNTFQAGHVATNLAGGYVSVNASGVSRRTQWSGCYAEGAADFAPWYEGPNVMGRSNVVTGGFLGVTPENTSQSYKAYPQESRDYATELNGGILRVPGVYFERVGSAVACEFGITTSQTNTNGVAITSGFSGNRGANRGTGYGFKIPYGTSAAPGATGGYTMGAQLFARWDAAQTKVIYDFMAKVELGPLLTVNGTGGLGAVLEPVVTAGVITSVRIICPGYGYPTVGTTVAVSNETTGSGAVLQVAINDGSITAVYIVNGGTGYPSTTPVTIAQVAEAGVYGKAFFPGTAVVSTTTPIWTTGAGTPEGVLTARVGSLYTRTDGGAATTLYVKETGTGNTGWVAK